MCLGTTFLSTATDNVRVLDAGSGLVQILDRRKAIVIEDGAHRSLNRAMIDLFSACGGTLKLIDDITEALGFDVEFAISISLQDLVHLERKPRSRRALGTGRGCPARNRLRLISA